MIKTGHGKQNSPRTVTAFSALDQANRRAQPIECFSDQPTGNTYWLPLLPMKGQSQGCRMPGVVGATAAEGAPVQGSPADHQACAGGSRLPADRRLGPARAAVSAGGGTAGPRTADHPRGHRIVTGRTISGKARGTVTRMPAKDHSTVGRACRLLPRPGAATGSHAGHPIRALRIRASPTITRSCREAATTGLRRRREAATTGLRRREEAPRSALGVAPPQPSPPSSLTGRQGGSATEGRAARWASSSG